MSIDIICPLYNAESFFPNLYEQFLKQTQVQLNKIRFVITKGSDSTEQIVKELSEKDSRVLYKVIEKSDFSHSTVREKEAFESDADIICFVTNDVLIEREDWLYNLTKDINNEVAATYSRQLPKFNGIEKYTREINYPAVSKIVSKEDIPELGLKTFFFSDAASAINCKIFKELNGYDQKVLPTNEDMYIAHKLITSGYKIKYCADSEVIHSHNFSLKEVYNRYKLTGQFFKTNSYMDNYGTTKAGGSMAKYVLKRALKDFNLKVLFRYPFDMAARLLGMKAGKK